MGDLPGPLPDGQAVWPTGSARPRVGFVGLGVMGAPMARRILQGDLDLVVWARRPHATAPFVRVGASAARSLRELATASDVVCLCVPASRDVRDVALGVDGVLRHMLEGSTLVVHSTIEPALCDELGRAAHERGIRAVDAPVSGGPAAAEQGRLTVPVGGQAADFARLAPVLECLGTPIHIGPLGFAMRLKLLNNALFTAHLGLVADAIVAIEMLSLPRELALEAIDKMSGSSGALRAAERLADPYERAHAIATLRKDWRYFTQVVPGIDGRLDVLSTTVRAALGDGRA